MIYIHMQKQSGCPMVQPLTSKNHFSSQRRAREVKPREEQEHIPALSELYCYIRANSGRGLPLCCFL